MVFLLVHTVGMVKFVNVKRVIIVKEKQQTQPLANLDFTPLKKDPLHASNVHPARMPTRWAPLSVKTAMVIPTNRILMLRNAFQCKKGITNRVQQPKSNARRVNQEAVAIQSVTIAWKARFKLTQVKLLALNAPVDGAILVTVQPVATPYHRGRTH